MAAFGSYYFLYETGSKLLFYFQRVAREVCLNTTSLLSVYQIIKLCPNFSRWMELRIRSPKCIGVCCFLCRIVHLLVNNFVPINITGPMHTENFNVKINYEYCSALDRLIRFVVVVIFSTTDLMYLGFMVWARSSMVLFLHRHEQ